MALTYKTSAVKIIRVNGRCLIGSSGMYSSVVIDSQKMQSVDTYGGTRREDDTEVRAHVGGEEAQRYRWITIY